MPVSLTRTMARAVLERVTQPVDAAVAAKVKLCLVDYVRGCLEALSLPWAPAVASMLDDAPAGTAMLWGTDRRFAPADAAFGNAILAHGLIQDDMHVPSGAHIGVVVIPSVLAMAETEKLSGAALLHGIAVGYDVMARVGAAVRAGLVNRHFRPSGLSGAYGATAGLIAALQLDEDVAVNALGFAANFASGLNEWPWSGGQEIFIHAGTAARAALTSIALARSGFTSSETILEGRDGMFAAYGSGQEAAAVFLKGLDEGRSILDVEHKPFPGCNFIQSPVAAALELRQQSGLAPDNIESVTIRSFGAARRYPGCDYAGPFDKVVQAKMSLQYGVAAALAHGKLTEAEFQHLDDPVVLKLLGRTRIETLAAFDACYPGRQPAEVVVTLSTGEMRSAVVDDVPWLTPDVVQQRFTEVASRRPGRGAAVAALAAIERLDMSGGSEEFFLALVRMVSA